MKHSDLDVSQVQGNVSPEIKRSLLSHMGSYIRSPAQVSRLTGQPFKRIENQLASGLLLTEVSVLPKAEEPDKLESRVVFEITIDEKMLNGHGNLHGGCTALLIDNCSTMPIFILSLATSGRGESGVSQSLNIVYHSPAPLGDKLRIVSTSITLGSRMFSSRCEMWNTTRHRLVASAVHVKMAPSGMNASAKL